MSRLREIGELTRVRVTLFLREPEALFWVFVFPLLLAAVLGFAFRSAEPEPSRVGLLGEAPALALLLEGVERLELVPYTDPDLAARALRSGGVDLLVVPASAANTAPGPAADSAALDALPVLRVQPARPEGETAKLRVLLALERAPGWPESYSRGLEPAERARLEAVEQRGARYVDFLFPGLLGMNLMGTGMWSIGFAVADMRQRKVLRRMLVTPMRRSSLLASLLLARLVFLTLEVVVLVAFGVFALGVPLEGSAFGLLALSFLGAVTFAGLGLLAASRARTIEAVSGFLNLFMLPMWLGSGVFFSYERFPDAVQPVLRLLPLTALNDGLRAVMLEGASVTSLGFETLVLVAWLAGGFALSLRLFRWS